MMVLMVCLIAMASYATEFILIGTHDSRYIFYGVDFAAKNDACVDTLGLSVKHKNFGAYGYTATSNSYFEWGIGLDYTLSIGKVNFKSIIWPFGWATHKAYWGAIVAEEVSINNPVASIVATWAYDYVPDQEFKELNGHYFFLGANKQILDFNVQAGINYNKNFFAAGEGMGGIVGLSKSLQLTEKIALDLYFKYYINAEKVNKDEQVVGATISVKL